MPATLIQMATQNQNPVDDHDKCISRIDLAISSNKDVQTLIKSISELGCSIPATFFKCAPCEGDVSGGFIPNTSAGQDPSYTPSIVVCENKFLPRDHFENTLIHELVHAYDQCRAKIDWTNCLHHACTEVRAATLSGECSLYQEALRFRFRPQGGEQECIERRANLSVASNTYCQKFAKEAVAKALEPCMRDSAPFPPIFDN